MCDKPKKQCTGCGLITSTYYNIAGVYLCVNCSCTRSIEDIEKQEKASLKGTVDMVNHPPHYKKHPSGIECIEVTRHMSFNLGNVIKYLWRADYKAGIEDLEKAAWYLNDEIKKRKTYEEN